MTDLIKLYNRGKRTIIGVHAGQLNEEGAPLGYEFKPESPMAFAHEDAVKIMKLYPKEVVDIEGVTKEFEEKTAAVEKTTAAKKSVSDSKARKKEIDDAVAAAVAVALAKNNEAHEAARVAAEKEAEKETGDEGKKEDAKAKDDDGAEFAKVKIGDLLGAPKK